MNFKSLLAAAALSIGAIALPAQAAPIVGSIGFSDGLEQSSLGQTTNIVSQLTFINDTATASESVTGCTSVFAAENSCTPTNQFVAFDFTYNVANQLVYMVDGFTFTVEGFGPATRTGLQCILLQCADSLTFLAFGTVVGNGYDASTFLMNWGANGNCNRNQTNTNTCSSDIVGTWNVVITAIGARQVPEPATPALLGLALAMLGFAVRRRKS